ncbi:phosphotyrosine protein phosphatase [Bacteroidia bacterium]|nr:phosphotyrosine protein phosphatase [Bacteroidia bacterium]
MAETIFRDIAQRNFNKNFRIDSAGTYGGHSGQKADARMREAAEQRGYNITHLSRKLTIDDFDNFDLLVVMDDENYYNAKNMAYTKSNINKIVKMADYLTKYTIDHIPDPYYEGKQGFNYVIDLLEDACQGLYDKIK